MYRVLVVLAALFALSACSSTTDYQSGAEVASTASGEDGVICERVPVTGTRKMEKVCTTAAQREARARNAQGAHSQVGRKAQQVGGPAGG
ncbi:hypothetical protein [Parahaliea mediterranea]|uniref:hypothetical protein n=1 Tax=Parahaliea mediterranea TaxID=651086 RepID=UPI0013006229|nr:hypothetical protein [Parahaliea mediterranea]